MILIRSVATRRSSVFVCKPQGAVKVWSHREWGREEEEDHGFNRRENLNLLSDLAAAIFFLKSVMTQ